MSAAADAFNIPKTHPRLFGNRERLQQLAKDRKEAYRRMATIARERNLREEGDKEFHRQVSHHSKLISMALVAAIEEDAKLSRACVDFVLTNYIDQPIRTGHVTFGADVALCAIAYDLCHAAWTDAERQRFYKYFHRTHDENLTEEISTFHNGWYGYKNWGFGLACLAVYHEDPRGHELLAGLDDEYRTRAAPALELSGEGGGFAEGFYVYYWLYQWLFFCECARLCAGMDYYKLAPKFFSQAAIAQMFETYPGIKEFGTRHSICIGDGRGRFFKVERDRALSCRRILVNYYRDDPAHQAVHAHNLATKMGAEELAYQEFLWFDPTVKAGDLNAFKLSHFSSGPGYVYARSSWKDDAAYLFFKCGKRFTAHQHLDVAHFYIYKNEELAGEGGHYDTFGGVHDTQYTIRTIAHNSILVHDPDERFQTGIRSYKGPPANDGGQAYPPFKFPSPPVVQDEIKTWFDRPRHNWGAWDPIEWYRHREKFDIAEMLAFEERGDYVYMAGDCSRAYSAKKLDHFTRQIVFIRPGTFVIFDRVKSTKPEFKKKWLLQAMKVPQKTSSHLIVTNGNGRLFVQTLLPANPEVKLVSGAELYRYDGGEYLTTLDTGACAECRVEISPSAPAREDFFLHVLTTTDAKVDSVAPGKVSSNANEITVEAGGKKIVFSKNAVSVAVS
jgi:heparin/heparan-sulfate lyase